MTNMTSASEVYLTLKQYPGLPIGKAYALTTWEPGQPIAFFYLQGAKRAGDLEWALRDLFVRYFNDTFVVGWPPMGIQSNGWKKMRVFLNVDVELAIPEQVRSIQLAMDRFSQQEFPQGWKPTGPEDPQILAAFSKE